MVFGGWLKTELAVAARLETDDPSLEATAAAPAQALIT